RFSSSSTNPFVWVTKETQRCALSSPLPTSAPVGQESMQIVQSPQSSMTGGSGGNGISVIISPRYTQEPNSGVMTEQLLPNQPMPARCATARSTSAPVSTMETQRQPG